jgi:hydroxypyruvate isomerase
MKRRDFVGAGLTAAAVMSVAKPGRASTITGQDRAFTLKYAPHLGMFEKSAGPDPVSQIDFMADQGFTAMEDNEMAGRPLAEQSRIAAAMARHNMGMGVFVAAKIGWSDPNLTSGDAAKREAFLADIRNSVEVAKRVNAKWMTVVPGLVDPRLEMSYQTANVVESLRQASAILESHGLVIVIEALNNLRDHPGQFLTRIPQSFLICQAVKSPSCKILFDMYHQQITEGNIIPNIDRAWDEIAYFQVGDNPGRKEPGTGEMNYRNIFRHIREKGYQGILGMEHGNSKPDKAGEQAVIDAYVAADS